MKDHLTKEEMEIFMDITFLLGSVLNVHILGERFLQQIGRLISYEKAYFLLYSNEEKRFYPCAEIRCSREFVEEYIQKYYQIDYLIWQLCQSFCKVMNETEEIDNELRKNTEFFKRFFKKNNLEYRLCFNALSQGGELLGVVMFFRSNIFPDFGEKERKVCEAIQVYFSQALENSRKFEQLTMNEIVNQQVYDSLDQVIMVIDSNFYIKYKNKAAVDYLHKHGGTGDIRRLPQVIKRHCETLIQKGKWKGDINHRVSTEEGILFIRMIKGGIPLFSGKRDILIVLQRETENAEIAEKPIMEGRILFKDSFLQILQKTYGLTQREAEIISFALDGYSNEEIKDKLFISMSTVKSHFQHAYSKISVANRKELLLLFTEYSTSSNYRKIFKKGMPDK